METLKRDDQFERVRRNGRTWATGLVVLSAARNDVGANRFGFVAGKKVGKSVERNRARRLIREAVRLRLPLIKPGWDLVWIARAGIADKKVDAVVAAVDDLLRRARVYAPGGIEAEGTQSRIMEGGRNPSGGVIILADPGAPSSNSQAQKQPQTE